jgi:hypothetical protein
MRRSPIVIGILLGLLVGGAGAAAVALSGSGGGPKPRLVVVGPGMGFAGAEVAQPPGGPTNVVIQVRGTLPELGGTARAYRIGTEPSMSVGALAKVLGLHGPVASDAGGWVVRDGNKLLRIQRTRGLPWFVTTYSGPCQVVPGIAPGGSSTQSRSVSPTPNATSGPGPTPTAAPIPVPPPRAERLPPVPAPGPTDCPSESTSVCPSGQPCAPPVPAVEPPMRLDPVPPALKLLTAAGLGAHDAPQVSSSQLNVAPRIDGRTTAGVDWTAVVSANGTVDAASGYLALPEPADSYRLIGTKAAVERLKETVPTFLLPSACASQGCPVQEHFVSVITGVRLGLLRGTTFLVPAYFYDFQGGDVHVVPAVEDKYLEVPALTPKPAGNQPPRPG